MLASVLVKVFVEIFKRLYLLYLWMEVVHTCPDVRYRSEVLCCTILIHMSDLPVNVTQTEIMFKFLFKVFRGKVQFMQASLLYDSSYKMEIYNEPAHGKTYNKTCVTSKYSD